MPPAQRLLVEVETPNTASHQPAVALCLQQRQQRQASVQHHTSRWWWRVREEGVASTPVGGEVANVLVVQAAHVLAALHVRHKLVVGAHHLQRVQLAACVVVQRVQRARREDNDVAHRHGDGVAVTVRVTLASQHKEQLVAGGVHVAGRVVARLKHFHAKRQAQAQLRGVKHKGQLVGLLGESERLELLHRPLHQHALAAVVQARQGQGH
mmetsp:Transcript_30698/g.78449  ORF Transcript_30698/g.78449 Transcript_30698/m.78449 type:complete len:210 (-) Transcript_30698:1216-1845(-)